MDCKFYLRIRKKLTKLLEFF